MLKYVLDINMTVLTDCMEMEWPRKYHSEVEVALYLWNAIWNVKIIKIIIIKYHNNISEVKKTILILKYWMFLVWLFNDSQRVIN